MSDASVAQLIDRLPDRFTDGRLDLDDARFRLHVDGTHRDVVVSKKACRIEAPSGSADAEIETDPATWRAMFSGELSGIEAFTQRRLSVRGSIEASLRFDLLFEHPAAGALHYAIERVDANGVKMSVLLAGEARREPLLLVHGLGATKASWLTVIPQLARRYRVIAMDLPGFGASDKPLGGYDAQWFAERVFWLMDSLGHRDAFVAGNSMGGRIAMEMAMRGPERVNGIACLCPATAFSRRPGLAIVRLLRPELGMLIGRLPRNRIKDGLKQLFADPTRIEEEWYDAAVDDFRRVWKSPRARLAFAASLKNIYMEEPDGDLGFWTRLARMSPPALYVYAKQDVLITPGFARKIQGA